jgi:hypothetical protein
MTVDDDRADPGAVSVGSAGPGGEHVDRGWLPVLDRLRERLRAEGCDSQVHVAVDRGGAPSVWLDDPDAQARFRESCLGTEAELYRTCSSCGRAGRPRNGALLRVSCDGCERPEDRRVRARYWVM